MLVFGLVVGQQVLRLIQLEGQVTLLSGESVPLLDQAVILELKLGVVLVAVLHFVPVQVQLVLNLLDADVAVTQLATLDVQLAFLGLDFLLVPGDDGLVLCLDRLQVCDLVGFALELLVENFDLLLGVGEVGENPLVLRLEVSVGRVHIVQFRLEFESQLDLFFVVFGVLRVVFLQLEAHLLLVHALSLQLLTQLVLGVEVLFQDLLVVGLLFRFLLIVSVHRLNFGLVFSADCRDQHLIVCATAVFEQNCKDFPDVGDHGVAFLGVFEALLDQLVEAYRVNVESPVDSVNGVVFDASVLEGNSVDAVADGWLLVLGLQDDPRNVKVLSVVEGFVDPRLQHLVGHLNLPVLGLEAGVLRLDLRLVCLVVVGVDRIEPARHGLGNLARFAPLAGELKESLFGELGAIAVLAVEAFSNFLSDERNVEEAFEVEGAALGASLDRWQLKADLIAV